jgi:hypothetical protein
MTNSVMNSTLLVISVLLIAVCAISLIMWLFRKQSCEHEYVWNSDGQEVLVRQCRKCAAIFGASCSHSFGDWKRVEGLDDVCLERTCKKCGTSEAKMI